MPPFKNYLLQKKSLTKLAGPTSDVEKSTSRHHLVFFFTLEVFFFTLKVFFFTLRGQKSGPEEVVVKLAQAPPLSPLSPSSRSTY